MSFITVLSYYLMVGCILGAMAAFRCKHLSEKWADYVESKEPDCPFSRDMIVRMFPVLIVGSFTLMWPFMLWSFVKIMLCGKMKWEGK